MFENLMKNVTNKSTHYSLCRAAVSRDTIFQSLGLVLTIHL